MNNQDSQNLRTAADIIIAVGMGASIIGGIYLLTSLSNLLAIGIATIAFGCLSSYVTYCILNGLAAIVENTSKKYHSNQSGKTEFQRNLKELYDDGLITKEEYEQKKKKEKHN